MATTLSRYLKLKIADDLSADAKYNLTKIDSLGATFSTDSTELLVIRSQEDIVIEPASPDIGGIGNGTLFIGQDNNPTTVEFYSTAVRLRSALSLPNNSLNQPETFLSLAADDEDANLTLTLGLNGDNRSVIFDRDGIATTTDGFQTLTNKTVDVGNNFFSNIRSFNLAPNAAVTYSQLSLTNSITNADINTAAAIAGSKIAPASATESGVVTTTAQTFSGPKVFSVNDGAAAVRIAQTGSGPSFVVEDETSPDSTPFIIDASGRVVSGHTISNIPISGGTVPGLQLFNRQLGSYRYVNDSTGNLAEFVKSRSNTTGTHTIVSNGDELGKVNFSGSDGAAFIRAAVISSVVDGTPATNGMPGRLIFSTTPSGSPTPVERLRIGADGLLTVSSLTASQVTATNASKQLVSLPYATANTASALVQRDASGNFSANIITASLTGNVTGNVSGTAANVTGVVSIANGGTGAITAPDAIAALLPSYTGNSLSTLRVNSTGDGIEWAVGAGTGTVTSVTSNGAPIIIAGTPNIAPRIGITQSTTSSDGYLTATDWNTFNGKQDAITGAATTVTSTNLTANRALISNASGKIAVSSTISDVELGYLDGVTSAIQTQINGKEGTIAAGTTSQYWRGDKSWQTLNTTAVTEGTNQYFTTTRARTAAVLNTTAGNETDQAPSVSAMKSYVGSFSGGTYAADWTTGASITLTHNLNTSDISVNIYDKTSWEEVYVDTIERGVGGGSNAGVTTQVTLTASVAPPVGGWRVIVKK